MERSILIVDDDESFSNFMRAHLARGGHRASTAATSGEARRLVKDERFDAVVIDGLLPDGTGMDLVAGVRQDGYRGTVVFISAFYKDGRALRSIVEKFSVARVLTKPILPHVFVDAVEAAISEGAAGTAGRKAPESQQEIHKRMDLLVSELARAVESARKVRSADLIVEAHHAAHRLSTGVSATAFPALAKSAETIEEALLEMIRTKGESAPWATIESTVKELLRIRSQPEASPGAPTPSRTTPVQGKPAVPRFATPAGGVAKLEPLSSLTPVQGNRPVRPVAPLLTPVQGTPRVTPPLPMMTPVGGTPNVGSVASSMPTPVGGMPSAGSARRRFVDTASREIESARAQRTAASVAILQPLLATVGAGQLEVVRGEVARLLATRFGADAACSQWSEHRIALSLGSTTAGGARDLLSRLALEVDGLALAGGAAGEVALAIGIATIPGDGDRVGDLLRLADERCDRAAKLPDGGVLP